MPSDPSEETDGGLQELNLDQPAPDLGARRQQIRQMVDARAAGEFEQAHPFNLSTDRPPVPTNRYRQAEATVLEQDRADAMAQRAQEIARRRQQTTDTEAFNSKARAQYEGSGQLSYIDPLTKRLVPVLEPGTNRPLFKVGDKSIGQDRQGLPAIIQRDKYGQQQYRRPPLKASEDPLEGQLYADLGDGQSVPYMSVDDALKHPDIQIRRQGMVADRARKNALRAASEEERKNALAPLEGAVTSADLQIKAARDRRDELEQAMNQLTEQIGGAAQTEAETTGLIMKTPTQRALVAKKINDQRRAQLSGLQTEADAIDESLKPRGALSGVKADAESKRAVFKAQAIIATYDDQIGMLQDRMKSGGGNPEKDAKTLATMQAARKAIADGLEAHTPQPPPAPVAQPEAGPAPVANIHPDQLPAEWAKSSPLERLKMLFGVRGYGQNEVEGAVPMIGSEAGGTKGGAFTIPKAQGTGVMAGIDNAVNKFISGMTTPENAGIMAATGGAGALADLAAATRVAVAARATEAATMGTFTGLMAKDTVTATQDAVAVMADPKATKAEKADAIATAILSGAMTGAAGAGTVDLVGRTRAEVRAAGRTPPPAPEAGQPAPTEPTPVAPTDEQLSAAKRTPITEPDRVAQRTAAIDQMSPEEQAKALAEAEGEAAAPAERAPMQSDLRSLTPAEEAAKKAPELAPEPTTEIQAGPEATQEPTADEATRSVADAQQNGITLRVDANGDVIRDATPVPAARSELAAPDQSPEPKPVPERMDDPNESLTAREILEYARDDRSHGDENLAAAAEELLSEGHGFGINLDVNIPVDRRQMILSELESRATEIGEKSEAIDVGGPTEREPTSATSAIIKTPEAKALPEPVNIGPRDSTVSTGTGVPTAKEEAMLKEQRRLVEEHLKGQAAEPTNAQIDSAFSAVASGREYKPAIRTESGKVYADESHTRAFANAKEAGENTASVARGFATSDGEFLNILQVARREIAKKSQPTTQNAPSPRPAIPEAKLPRAEERPAVPENQKEVRAAKGAEPDDGNRAGGGGEGGGAGVVREVGAKTEPSDRVKQLRRDLKDLRDEMKAAGVRKVSPFNGGLSGDEVAMNTRRFRIETELKRAEAESPKTPEAKPAGTVAEQSDVRATSDTPPAQMKPVGGGAEKSDLQIAYDSILEKQGRAAADAYAEKMKKAGEWRPSANTQVPAPPRGSTSAPNDLIARSKPKPRADVDNGTRYSEWRIRKVTAEDYEKLSEGQRSRGDASVGDFKVERRIIKTQEGGPTETGEWETSSYGKTKKEAVEDAHYEQGYMDAESLDPAHEKAVQDSRARAEELRRIEANKSADLKAEDELREKYIQEVRATPLKGTSREIDIAFNDADGNPSTRKESAMVYGNWAITKKGEGKRAEYVVTHVPTGLKVQSKPTVGQAKEVIQAFIHSGLDVASKDLVSDRDTVAKLAQAARALNGGTAPEWFKGGSETAEKASPAQMSAKARIAELEGAGVSTINGKPLKDANAAEIINAVGKLRRGQLEPDSTTPSSRVISEFRSGDHKPAHVDISADGPKTVVLNNIDVPEAERGKGHGSRALDSLIKSADKNGVTLELEIGAGETPSDIDLVKWYESRGFKAEDGYWKRAPKTDAPPRASDRAIAALQKAKIGKPGRILSADPFTVAYDAAIDFAILAIRAGRAVGDVVKLATQRFMAKHPKATPEEVARVTQAINSAVAAPAKPITPESKPSLLPESLKAAGAPAETINYEVRTQDARKQEASDIIKRDGAAKAEQMITSSELPGDTKVAIGGQLINDKMLSLAKATPEEAAKLANDIQRITAKMQPKLATEAGQTISMFGGIYDDVRTASAMEYIRDAQSKRLEKMGGEEGGKAADEAAKIFNKTKDPAAREKDIEKLKERYTTKPVRRMLDQLKRMEVAQKLNSLGVLTRDDMVEVAGNALGIPGISQKRLKHIAELADRVHTAKNHAERSRAELELSDTLNIYKGVSPLDLEASILTLNILSGPTTQAANILGNTLQGISQIGHAALANPTKVRALVDGILDGIPDGMTQAKSILATGRGSRDFADKTGGSSNVLNTIDYAEDYPSLPKKAADALTTRARMVEKISRFMKAADAVFYYPAREAYARLVTTKLLEGQYKGDELDAKVDQLLHTTTASFESARKQAEGEGYDGIDLGRRVSDIIEERRAQTPIGAEAVKQSERFAAESTYNQEPVGLAGVIYRNLARTTSEANIGGVPILKPWTMFLKVPANVFNETTNFTPIGGVRATFGMQGEKYRKGGTGEGQWRNFNRDERNRLYLKSIVGTTLMAGLVARSIQNPDDTPIVSANGPQDTAKRRQLMNAGWKPYSIRVGDKWISYRDSPLLVPLAVAGHVSDSLRYNKPEPDVTTEQRVADAVLASPQTIFQTSMLSGMADLMASLSGKGGGLQAVGRTLGSIPANLVIPYNRLLQQIDQTFDPKTYDTNAVVGGVPFVRRMGNEIADVQGRPQTYSPSERFASAESKDPVDRLLLDKNLAIPEVGRDVKIGNRNMTEDEHDLYRKISGQRIRVRLQTIEPRLRGMTREKAQDEIERISREERARVKPRIAAQAPLATAAK